MWELSCFHTSKKVILKTTQCESHHEIDQYTFFIIADVDIIEHLWFLYVAIKSNNFENRKIGKSKKELAKIMYQNNQATSDQTVSIIKFMRHDFDRNHQKYTDYLQAMCKNSIVTEIECKIPLYQANATCTQLSSGRSNKTVVHRMLF